MEDLLKSDPDMDGINKAMAEVVEEEDEEDDEEKDEDEPLDKAKEDEALDDKEDEQVHYITVQYSTLTVQKGHIIYITTTLN